MGLQEKEFKSLRGDFKVILRKEKVEIGIQNNTENTQSGQKRTDQISELKTIDDKIYI